MPVKKPWIQYSLTATLLLFIPLAMFAALLPTNEYLTQGIKDGIDCDGPMAIMICAVPSYLVYMTGLCAFIYFYRASKSTVHLCAILLCAVVLAAMTPNLSAALEQHNINQTRYGETCGQGW